MDLIPVYVRPSVGCGETGGLFLRECVTARLKVVGRKAVDAGDGGAFWFE
jgi:hypothetical protein